MLKFFRKKCLAPPVINHMVTVVMIRMMITCPSLGCCPAATLFCCPKRYYGQTVGQISLNLYQSHYDQETLPSVHVSTSVVMW